MTVKELLESVTFIDIKPYLLEYLGHPPYDFLGSARELHSYREAYDRLLIAEVDEKSKDGEVFLEDLMDSAWRYQLPKHYDEEMYKDKPLAKTAALALWNLTYYGTSDKIIKARFENWFNRMAPINKFDVALRKLEDSYFRHQIPLRFRNFSNNHWYYRMARPNDIKGRKKYEAYVNRKKFNRPKRMRKHRQEERKDWLKKMRAKQYIIDLFTSEGSSFIKDTLDFIYRSTGTLEDFHAIRPCNPLDYVVESLEKYTELPYSNYDKSIVFVEVPNGWSVSDEEIGLFKQKVKNIIGYPDILFGSREYNGDELNMYVLLFKLK